MLLELFSLTWHVTSNRGICLCCLFPSGAKKCQRLESVCNVNTAVLAQCQGDAHPNVSQHKAFSARRTSAMILTWRPALKRLYSKSRLNKYHLIAEICFTARLVVGRETEGWMSHLNFNYKIKVVSKYRYEINLKLNLQNATKMSYRNSGTKQKGGGREVWPQSGNWGCFILSS